MDNSKLEKELSTAFEKEHKRRAEDEMKKRAILTAKSYDEFRHLVAAATQKPIDRSDIAKKGEVSANKVLIGTLHNKQQNFGFGIPTPTSSSASSSVDARSSLLASSASSMPSTAAEVDRAWRRLPKGTADRYWYLASVGATRLAACFKADVDGMLLGQMLLVIAAASKELPRAIAVSDATAAPASAPPSAEASEGTEPAPAPAPASSSSSSAIGKPQPTFDPIAAAEILLAFSRSLGFGFARELLSNEEAGAATAVADAAAATAGAAGAAVAARVRAAYKLQ